MPSVKFSIGKVVHILTMTTEPVVMRRPLTESTNWNVIISPLSRNLVTIAIATPITTSATIPNVTDFFIPVRLSVLPESNLFEIFRSGETRAHS